AQPSPEVEAGGHEDQKRRPGHQLPLGEDPPQVEAWEGVVVPGDDVEDGWDHAWENMSSIPRGSGCPSRRGWGIIAPVAAASTTIPASRLHGHHDRPSMVSVGTIIWLSSELMFFAALFASYFPIRSVSPELWAQSTEKLNVPFAAVNTTILVLSSLTCQLGVFAAERGQVGRTGSVLRVSGWGLREWFVLTYIMGAVFI